MVSTWGFCVLLSHSVLRSSHWKTFVGTMRWECSTSPMNTAGADLYSLARKILIMTKVSLTGLEMHDCLVTTKKDALLPGSLGDSAGQVSDS